VAAAASGRGSQKLGVLHVFLCAVLTIVWW
jgi:hypothetical protein